MTETTEATRTFTQADVDRIVSERLASEREQVGVLKRELSSVKRDLESRNGEVEKLDKQVNTLTEERDDARESSKTAASRALNAQMRAEVTTAAVLAGAVDSEDVFRLLPEGAISVNAETGQIEGVQDAVTTLVGEKPHLFTAPARPGTGDAGAREETGSPARAAPNMTDLIRRAGGRST